MCADLRRVACESNETRRDRAHSHPTARFIPRHRRCSASSDASAAAKPRGASAHCQGSSAKVHLTGLTSGSPDSDHRPRPRLVEMPPPRPDRSPHPPGMRSRRGCLCGAIFRSSWISRRGAYSNRRWRGR
jgi:hypothetical protein